VLQELPVQVHNSHLAHAFLYELRESKDMRADPMAIHVNHFVEQHLDNLTESIDAFTTQTGTFEYHGRKLQRQKQDQERWEKERKQTNELREKQGKERLPDDRFKNPIFKTLEPPERLSRFLLTRRMAETSGALLGDTTQGFAKMYVVDALRR
jgi:hypothetical protein